MRNVDTKKSVIVPVHAVEDNGAVRIGYMSPSLPPVRSAPASSEDKGAVRIGFMSPSLPPVRSAPPSSEDKGAVRIGFMSPNL
jgi:hypothetical protein